MVCIPATPTTLASTPLTRSSTVCVALRFCAMAIRASSCVSLSSLFSESSKSVFPNNLLMYFSDHHAVNHNRSLWEVLTHSALLDFLCRYCEDTEYLHHDLHNDIHHYRCRWHHGVHFEPSDEILNTL